MTKQEAQQRKEIKEFLTELPILKKRLEILEAGNEERFQDNLLRNFYKSPTFAEQNIESYMLMLDMHEMISRIVEHLTKENCKNARSSLQTTRRSRSAKG